MTQSRQTRRRLERRDQARLEQLKRALAAMAEVLGWASDVRLEYDGERVATTCFAVWPDPDEDSHVLRLSGAIQGDIKAMGAEVAAWLNRLHNPPPPPEPWLGQEAA